MAEPNSNARTSNPQDLTGMPSGKLRVLREVERSQCRRRSWWCQCDCGNVMKVAACRLLLSPGGTRSCGCLRRDWCSGSLRVKNTRHGKSKTSEYQTWQGLIGRCLDPDDPGFKDYGGRGITVCERWAGSFEAFYEDMGLRPSGDHSIERIDNDGPYAPGNCKWATRFEQGRNKRSNHRLEHGGESLILAEWARITGIPKNVILNRLNLGWTVSRALTQPVTHTRPSVRLSDPQIAEVKALRLEGFTYQAISDRYGISAAMACLIYNGKRRNKIS
jgi:hypothetical protein